MALGLSSLIGGLQNRKRLRTKTAKQTQLLLMSIALALSVVQVWIGLGIVLDDHTNFDANLDVVPFKECLMIHGLTKTPDMLDEDFFSCKVRSIRVNTRCEWME